MTNVSESLVFQQVNALIAINKERFKTYARAMEKSEDSNFRSLCAQNKERTIHFNVQLIRCLAQYDVLPATGETGLSKAFNFGWIRRPGFLHHARGFSRGACRWWDAIALKAYRKAVQDLQNIPQEIRRILMLQQSMLESDNRYAGIAV
jgi:hypothetical protein